MVLRPSVLARRRDARGAVALLVALTSSVLMMTAGLVVDLGMAWAQSARAQNAADASALAAGNALYPTGTETPDITAAIKAAQDYALANFGVSAAAWSGCTDTGKLVYAPTTPCISFDSQTLPAHVRVRIPPSSVHTVFAGLAGVNSFSINAGATAGLNVGQPLNCGLCILGSGQLHNLQNGDATLHGGNIHFNGDVSVSANGLIATDGKITVEGSASGPPTNYVPAPATGVPPITDPLAGLALPPAMTGLTLHTNPCHDGPGIYGGPGVTLNLRGIDCALAPGLYVIQGGTWDLAGNASTYLHGTGVTLYLTCSTAIATPTPRACNPGEAGATIDASGQGTLGLQAPTTGPLAGLTIVYDRNNTQLLRLTGNGSANFTGTIYGASLATQMNGNGCATTYNSAMVVKDLQMNGNPACLDMTYVRNQNWKPPPSSLRLTQ